MKAKEIRQMNDQDLMNKLKDIRTEYMKEQSQVAVGTVPKSPGKIKDMRRTIAKINTILHERQSKK